MGDKYIKIQLPEDFHSRNPAGFLTPKSSVLPENIISNGKNGIQRWANIAQVA